MRKPSFRTWFKKALGPLIWLAGLGAIIWLAPVASRVLIQSRNEQVIGFCGRSHELVTVTGILADLKAAVPMLDEIVSIQFWDLDLGTSRTLQLPDEGVVCSVSTCSAARRLCIMRKLGAPSSSVKTWRLTIVDADSGKSIRAVDWTRREPEWRISDDGRTLVCANWPDGEDWMSCLDVDTGARLHQVRDRSGFISAGQLSPDGRYLAMDRGSGVQDLIDLVSHREVGSFQTADSANGFVPHGGRFKRLEGGVYDITSKQVICPASPNAVFADGGKKIAWLKNRDGKATVMWRDVETQREWAGPSVGFPLNVTLLDAVDSEGNVLRCVSMPMSNDPTWFQRALGWLGLKRPGSSNLSISFEWLLLDSRSGAVLLQGRNSSPTVSSDGRFVVTSDGERSEVRVYEQPLRRSMIFMAIGSAVWTLALAGVWKWRRRVSRKDDAEQSYVHLSKAAPADTP